MLLTHLLFISITWLVFSYNFYIGFLPAVTLLIYEFYCKMKSMLCWSFGNIINIRSSNNNNSICVVLFCSFCFYPMSCCCFTFSSLLSLKDQVFFALSHGNFHHCSLDASEFFINLYSACNLLRITYSAKGQHYCAWHNFRCYFKCPFNFLLIYLFVVRAIFVIFLWCFDKNLILNLTGASTY